MKYKENELSTIEDLLEERKLCFSLIATIESKHKWLADKLNTDVSTDFSITDKSLVRVANLYNDFELYELNERLDKPTVINVMVSLI